MIAAVPSGMSWNTTTGNFTGTPEGMSLAFPTFGGVVHNCSSVTQVNTALSTYNNGDIINITADLVLTTSFVIPVRGLLWIRTSNYAALDVAVPYSADYMAATKAANRVDRTTHAGILRKIIVRANNTPAFRFESASHDIWFTGLEIFSDLGYVQQQGLIEIVGRLSHTSEADFPTDIAIDRCFVGQYNSTTDNVRRAIRADGRRIRIANSDLRVGFESASDTQAVASFAGSRSVILYNNTLQAGIENFMIGGSTVTVNNYDPKDWAVIRNHVYKDPAWATAVHGKNWLELKHSLRVLHYGNVCENFYPKTQAYGIITNVANQTGANPWAKVEDAIYWCNKFINCQGGLLDFAMNGSNPASNMGTRRIEFAHNWAPGPWGGENRMLILASSGTTANDIAMYHNLFAATTALIATNAASSYGASQGFYFCDNINRGTPLYGPFYESGGPQNQAVLDAIWDAIVSGWTVRNNWKKSGTSDNNWSAGTGTQTLLNSPHDNKNYTNESDIFNNPGASDYSVKSSSPAYNSCLDGTSPGPNYTLLNTATAGVV